MSDVSQTDLDESLNDEGGRLRPAPQGSLRGAPARHLAAGDPAYGPRPAHLGLLVAAYALAGLLLMLGGLVIAVASG